MAGSLLVSGSWRRYVCRASAATAALLVLAIIAAPILPAAASVPMTTSTSAQVKSQPEVSVPTSRKFTGSDPAIAYHLSNWSGYVAHGSAKEFTSVSGGWTVPVVSCSSGGQSAAWVGLDGSGDHTVEQTGVNTVCGPTLGSCAGDPRGTPCEYAWYEMYPGGLNVYDDPISTGDTMMASVSYARTTFTLSISDLTQGWTETAPPQTLHSARRATCEAIMESWDVPIPAFDTLNFSDVSCNGEPLETFNPIAGCTEGSGTVVYCPGAIQDEDSFSITPTPTETIVLCDDTTATVGAYFSCPVTTTGALTPPLKEVGKLPKGLTFVDNGDGSGTLSGTPAPNTGGSYSGTIVATLNPGPPPVIVEQTFTITVDQPPTFRGKSSTSVYVGEPLAFTIRTSGYPTPAITLTGGALPSDVTLTDNGDGTASLAGTPASGSAGTYDLAISASNGVGTPAEKNFKLVVRS